MQRTIFQRLDKHAGTKKKEEKTKTQKNSTSHTYHYATDGKDIGETHVNEFFFEFFFFC